MINLARVHRAFLCDYILCWAFGSTYNGLSIQHTTISSQPSQLSRAEQENPDPKAQNRAATERMRAKSGFEKLKFGSQFIALLRCI